METIKFRAWIPSAKKMISDGLEIGNFGYGEGSLGINPDLQKGEALKGLVWMQFTGLLDKNGKGKECYEKDIVEYQVGGAGSRKHIGVVEMYKGYWGVGEGFSFGALTEWKILGNIYENKELLK